MNKGLVARLQLMGSYGFLVSLLVVVVFPFYWMTVTSFKGEDQMRSLVSMFWPSPPVTENYEHLLRKTEFVSWFRNSVFVAISSTFVATAIGTIGAYPSFTIPFVTWLLMGYFESIPVELEEAAMIDGATRFGAFRRVILPLAAPGVLAAGLYAFTQAWNEFLYALVFITNVKLRTLPVGLSTFITGDVYGWGYLMAGAVLTTLPVIAAYIYLQKYMVEGLTAGSVKG